MPNAQRGAKRRGLHDGDGVELQVGELRRRRLLRADRRAVQRQVQVVQRRRARRARAATCRPGSPTRPARAISRATRPSSARRCSATRARRSRTARAATAPTASAATPTATAPASSATWPAKLGTCSPVPNGIEDPPTCVSDRSEPRACDGTGTCTTGPRATGKPCTAGAQCTSKYCVDGFCCNSSCATTCYTCNKPSAEGTLLGASRSASRITAPPRRAMARCSTAAGRARA